MPDPNAAIGALRHRLILQAESPIADGGGGQGSDPWASPATVATVWGRVEPIGGTERLRAMRLEGHVTHRVTIRHRAGVTAGMRVRFDVRVLNIRAVIDVGERGRILELLCAEGVAT